MCKKASLLLSLVVLSVMIQNVCLGQQGFAVFGDPTASMCAGTGICKAQTTEFPYNGYNSTYVYFTYAPVVAGSTVLYNASIIIFMNELLVNQPVQYNKFLSSASGGYPFSSPVTITADMLGGSFKNTFPMGYVVIPAGTVGTYQINPQFPFFITVSLGNLPITSGMHTGGHRPTSNDVNDGPHKHRSVRAYN